MPKINKRLLRLGASLSLYVLGVIKLMQTNDISVAVLAGFFSSLVLFERG